MATGSPGKRAREDIRAEEDFVTQYVYCEESISRAMVRVFDTVCLDRCDRNWPESFAVSLGAGRDGGLWLLSNEEARMGSSGRSL